MVYKPLDERTYLQYLKIVGWQLKKGSIDYKLYDQNNNFVCAIKISHEKLSKKLLPEVSTEQSKNLN